jgi:hypothetical protein
MLPAMFRLRQLIRSKRLSRMLSVGVAYALAIQALMASVGTGMSAFAASGDAGIVICGQVSALPPGPAGDHQRPGSVPQCPFCFIAAQSAGQFALAGAAPVAPAYTAIAVALIADPIGGAAFVPRFRRTAGAPRAPPSFSA